MPSVLIVDDEQHIRLLIEQTLEELEDDGVELLTASDGEEALGVDREPASGPRVPRRDDAEQERLRGLPRDQARPGLAGTFVVPADRQGPGPRPRAGSRRRRRPVHDQAVRSRRAARDALARSSASRRPPDGAAELRRLIVRHRHVAPMLSVLLAGTDARRRRSRDAEGEMILDRRPDGAGAATARRAPLPIVVEGETVGWVEGPRPAGAIAAVLVVRVPRARRTSGPSHARRSIAIAS